MKKPIVATSMALAMAFTVFGPPAAGAAEVKLNLVSMLPKKTPIGQAFGGFINRLNKELSGEFQIDWRGGPEVVPQFKQPNAVRLGSVDMTLTSPSYANGILNVSGSANYSNKQYNAIKSTGYHDYMAKLHAPKGLIYIGELPVSHQLNGSCTSHDVEQDAASLLGVRMALEDTFQARKRTVQHYDSQTWAETLSTILA